MEKYQLEYYNSLVESDQMILKAAALKANFSNESEITEVLSIKSKATQKEVNLVLEDAVRYKLLEKPTRYYYGGRYKASVPFMIFIFPQLNDFKHEW